MGVSAEGREWYILMDITSSQNAGKLKIADQLPRYQEL